LLGIYVFHRKENGLFFFSKKKKAGVANLGLEFCNFNHTDVTQCCAEDVRGQPKDWRGGRSVAKEAVMTWERLHTSLGYSHGSRIFLVERGDE